ncbi:JmjC domain-containing protein [Micromonospora echinospora]
MTFTAELKSDHGYPALARCLSIDARDFLDNYFGRRLVHTSAEALTADFSDLFSIDAVNAILSSGGLRTSSLRIVREDQQLDPRNYGRAGGGDRPGESPYVDAERVAMALRDGSSLVIRSLHRHHRPLMDFAHALSAELGYPVHINAYVTPAGSQAVKMHFDTHDVLVLQIAGNKTWEIRKPILPDPLTDQAWQKMGAVRREQLLAQSELLEEVVLCPGDTFHLPRGFLHSARAGTEVSIQLTIAIMTTTRYDLLQSLITLAQDDPWFRQRVPLHDFRASEMVADLIPQVVHRMLDIGAPSAAPMVIRHLDQNRWEDLPPEPLAVLPPDPCFTYRPRAGTRYWREERDGRVSVVNGTKRVTLSNEAGPVLQAALTSSRLDLRQPPEGVDAAIWGNIIVALAKIGLLMPDTDQAASSEVPC